MTKGVSANVSNVSVGGTVTQSELAELRRANVLSHCPVVYRVARGHLGGGFGDQTKYPYAWAVVVYADGRPARVVGARGAGREWTSLDRLERWLREQGFRAWCVRNDLEPTDRPSIQDGYPARPPVIIK